VLKKRSVQERERMKKKRGGRGRKAEKYKEGNTGSESLLPGVTAWRAGAHLILIVKAGRSKGYRLVTATSSRQSLRCSAVQARQALEEMATEESTNLVQTDSKRE
jgi:hypothetical protein